MFTNVLNHFFFFFLVLQSRPKSSLKLSEQELINRFLKIALKSLRVYQYVHGLKNRSMTETLDLFSAMLAQLDLKTFRGIWAANIDLYFNLVCF